MAVVYVEARPKGRPEGSPIHDYAVEDHADHVLHVASTQLDAINWATCLCAKQRQMAESRKFAYTYCV